MGEENAGILEQIQNQVQDRSATTTERELTEEEKELGDFAAVVLADTEDVWNELFIQNDASYREPGMVLFTNAFRTSCGGASSAAGPFYCPADEKIYMDLDFFKELKTRFGAEGGDFAIAYVIAHEVGHHMQNLTGTAGEVRKLQQGGAGQEPNFLLPWSFRQISMPGSGLTTMMSTSKKEILGRL